MESITNNYYYSYGNPRSQNIYDPFGNPIKQEPGTNGEFSNNNGTSNNGNSNPLAHLNESVNSLDPLNAMEKSLNDQVSVKM